MRSGCATGSSTRRRFSLLAAATGVVLVAGTAMGVDRTWQVGSGTLQTPANWSGGAVPGFTDRAIFDSASSNYTVTSSGGILIGSLQFSDSMTLNLGASNITLGSNGGNSIFFDPPGIQTVQLSNGSLTGPGGLNAGGSLGDLDLAVLANATLSLNNIVFNGLGNFSVSGRVNTISGGVSLATLTGSTQSRLTVTSSGSMSVGAGLVVGQAGTAGLLNAGDIQAGSVVIGSGAGSTGTLNMFAAATLVSTGTFTCGQLGAASILFNDGTITAGNVRIGEGSLGVGNFVIDRNALNARLNAGTSLIIGSAGQGTLLLRNGAVADVGGAVIIAGGLATGNAGTLRLENGSSLTSTGSLLLADTGVGTVDVLGNSTLSLSGALRATGSIDSVAHINIAGGSQVSADGAPSVFGGNGRLNLNVRDGGRLLTGNVDFIESGGSGVGTATIAGGDALWNVDGVLNLGNGAGPTVLVAVEHGGMLTSTSSIIVYPGSTLRLAGGTISAASFVQNLNGSGQRGLFDFQSGTLIFGPSGTIGLAGFFEGPFLADADHNLRATGLLTVTAGLIMRGGHVSAGTLSNSLFSELVLDDPASSLIVTSQLANSGIIRGNGRITGPLNNAAIGEVRSGLLDRIEVFGAGTNNGLISLQGGQVEFNNSLTNSTSGRITGRGLLQAAAIDNSGTITLSAGLSDVYGPLTNQSGGRTIVTGAGNATFYDAVTNNAGSEFRVSTGSTATFISPVTGLSLFTGSGIKIFEAGASGGPLVTAGSSVVETDGSISAAAIREESLSLLGGDAAIDADGSDSATSRLKSLVISGSPGAWHGQLDLADNALVIDYSGGSPINTIRSQLLSGRAGGAWSGQGIASSAAAVTPNRALGYADALDIGSPTMFAGQFIDPSTVLVRYTIPGDANLDRTVNIDDFGLLASNFNTFNRWSRGDFDYSGMVDIDDFALLAANFNQALPAGSWRSTAVPEPAGAVSLVLAAVARRRRR